MAATKIQRAFRSYTHKGTDAAKLAFKVRLPSRNGFTTLFINSELNVTVGSFQDHIAPILIVIGNGISDRSKVAIGSFVCDLCVYVSCSFLFPNTAKATVIGIKVDSFRVMLCGKDLSVEAFRRVAEYADRDVEIQKSSLKQLLL